MKLLLASKSAARRRMLEAAGVAFEIVESMLNEDDAKAALGARNMPAANLALALSEAKALAVTADADDLVLGSDQTLELESGLMLDKAADREQLLTQLRELSGRPHKLHAAACIVQNGAPVWRATETARLFVRPLGVAFLQDYLDREWEQVRWSVGGYHVEGRGTQLFERIDGSHFAVQGLPLLPLLGFLRSQGMMLS